MVKFKEECRDIKPDLYCQWYIEDFKIIDKTTRLRYGNGKTASSAWKNAYKNIKRR